jgi:leucyl aminopeptidase (aminopeptidase T)
VRTAPAIQLSPEERSRLRRWSEGAASEPERAERARLILRAAEGAQDREIARELGLHRLTVARWRQRFLRGRLGGLEPRRRLVVEGRVPADRIRAIVRATLGRGAAGRRVSTRTIGRSFGVSHMTVSRIWAAYGLRPARYGPFPPRADPTPAEAPWDVAGLLIDAPRAALVLTVHPRPVAAPAPAHGPTPDLPGILGPVRELLTAPAGPSAEVPPAGEIERFLGRVHDQLPGTLRAHALVTGLPESGWRALDRWRVRHPRLRIDATPEFGLWRRRAEELLREAGRLDGETRGFHGRAEVLRSLRQFLAAYGGPPRVVEWVAPAGDLAEGEAAYRLRHDLAVTGEPVFMTRPSLSPGMAPLRADDEAARAMARRVLRKYLAVRPGERVTIESWSSTLAEANAFVLETLRAGARPLLLYQDEPTYWAAATEVPARRLAVLGEHRKAALERTDVLVSFFGPSDRERFHALPSATMFQLGAYQDALYDAAAKAGARAVQMALGRVSAASARMYGVDETAWRKELVEACLLDPARFRKEGARLADRLRRGRKLELRHPNGTELTLRLAGRRPQVSDGAVRPARPRSLWTLTTLPAGVVSVAVDERSAEGVFRSNVTSSIGLSDTVGELAGGRWTFRDGRLANFRYDEGEEFFQQSYGRAKEGRDRPASISIGLNPALKIAPLLEDQGRGTITLHIGRNDYLGGRTSTPWWAWLFLRGAELLVDGRPLVQGGELLR